MDELSKKFDPKSVTKSAAKFDPSELDSLNKKIVHQLNYASVKPRLDDMGVGGGEDFWIAVKDNLGKVTEAAELWALVEAATPVVDAEDADFIATAKSVLPEGEWSVETWGQWLNEIKQVSDRKGKGLFMPLRKALTGMEHGPELDKMLPLIGRERTLARLS
jgi:glutamyl-tRNA synthetase